MKKRELIIQLSNQKIEELGRWRKVRYETGRFNYEVTRIISEIADFDDELKILYLEHLLQADFIIQDNLPSSAPDITNEVKGWIRKQITRIKIFMDKNEETSVKPVADKKIFISHSAKDISVVRSFTEKVLQLGLDIPADRIFCSSIEGCDIKSGQYMPDRIKTEIHSSNLALLFISKNYKESEICLNELGAAWVTLCKESVIPILMPGVEFNELGFLDIQRLGLKISEKTDIMKLVQDCRNQLNPTFNLHRLTVKVDSFIKSLPEIEIVAPVGDVKQLDTDQSSFQNSQQECYDDFLYPFSRVLRKGIPAFNDGIHNLSDPIIQKNILEGLNDIERLSEIWYRFAKGDFYIERTKKTPDNTWLISEFNWEIGISDMWVGIDVSPHNEFILIKTRQLGPYKIDSDVGGEDYNVGVLRDGRVVSENERLNGFAIFDGEAIDVFENGVESRYRDRKSHWIFFASGYHKIGFCDRDTIEYCKKLDAGKIEVTEDNLEYFVSTLHTHPTVRSLF